MKGKDAPASVTPTTTSRRKWSGWIWILVAAVVVMSFGITIRRIEVRQALAQAPVIQAGSAGAPQRPGTIARPGSPAVQPSTPAVAARPQAPPQGNVQQATAVKPVAPVSAANVQVMAVVNGEQITRTDLGRECIRRYGEEVLESMVNRLLISDACAQRGVQVTDADVTTEIDKVANRFGLSRDRWLQLLREERGFSEEQYRREVLWPMLALRQLVASQIQVSDEDLKKAFESEFGTKVRTRVICVDSQQKADQARAAAVADPNSFGELSKKVSVEPGVAAAYGVIPPIRKHLGDPHLEQVAFGMKPGQISEVIHVANMYYILKCEEILPPQYLATQQLAEQQTRLKEKIKENKLRAAAGDFFEQIKKQAQIVLVLTDKEKQKEMPNVAATVSGRQITLDQLAAECITRHGSEVLDGEINRKILQQELNKKKLAVADQDYDAEIGRAAEAYGFVKADGSPDIEKWLKSVTEQPGATVDLYLRDAVWPSVVLKKLVGSRVEISDEDLRKGYESNYGERVEVQAIVFSDLRQAQKVWELARNNNTEPFFSELAQQYSVEPSSRGNGGKVPPIRRYGGSPLIEEEAFKLKAGELSGIIAVDGQFIMLRCTGRTKQVQTDFKQVRSELVKDIQEKKLRVLMTKEFDRLRDVAQVDNFLGGSSQSGPRSTSPVTLSPAAGANRQGAVPPLGAPKAPGTIPASAAMPRGAQAR